MLPVSLKTPFHPPRFGNQSSEPPRKSFADLLSEGLSFGQKPNTPSPIEPTAGDAFNYHLTLENVRDGSAQYSDPAVQQSLLTLPLNIEAEMFDLSAAQASFQAGIPGNPHANAQAVIAQGYSRMADAAARPDQSRTNDIKGAMGIETPLVTPESVLVPRLIDINEPRLDF